MDDNTRSPLIGCATVLAVHLAALLGTCVYLKASFENGRIPSNTRVEQTIFSKEEAWGLGPGGNEAGLLIYELNSEDAAHLVSRERFLKSSDQIRSEIDPADSSYYEWKRTPIPNILQESENECADRTESSTLRIEDYIQQYCYFITVDPAYKQMVDKIIALPGSYHAFGDGGSLIIVAPRQRKIVLAYAG